MMAKQVVCTKCGNTEVQGRMRDRYPLAPEPFWRCLDCGAGVWDSDMSETSTIRPVELPSLVVVMAEQMAEYLA